MHGCSCRPFDTCFNTEHIRCEGISSKRWNKQHIYYIMMILSLGLTFWLLGCCFCVPVHVHVSPVCNISHCCIGAPVLEMIMGYARYFSYRICPELSHSTWIVSSIFVPVNSSICRYQESRISFYLAGVVFSCVTVVEAAGCDDQPNWWPADDNSH